MIGRLLPRRDEFIPPRSATSRQAQLDAGNCKNMLPGVTAPVGHGLRRPHQLHSWPPDPDRRRCKHSTMSCDRVRYIGFSNLPPISRQRGRAEVLGTANFVMSSRCHNLLFRETSA